MFARRSACWHVSLFTFLSLSISAQSAWAQQFNPFSGGSSNASSALSGGGSGQTQTPSIGAAASPADVSSQFQSLNSSAGAGGGNSGAAFVGQGNSAGRLVGSSRSGQAGSNNQTRNFSQSRASNQLRNFNRSQGNFANRSSFNQFRTGRSNTGSFRPAQKIAFTFPKRTTPNVASMLKTRFADLSISSTRMAALKSVAFDVDDSGQVTLTGNVASEQVKRLATALVRLEPGVRSVTNDLTVAAVTQ